MPKMVKSEVTIEQLEAVISTANRHVVELEFWLEKCKEYNVKVTQIEAWDTLQGPRGATRKLRTGVNYLAEYVERVMAGNIDPKTGKETGKKKLAPRKRKK